MGIVFGVLGPLEVRSSEGTTISLGGQKPRSLLAAVLLHRGQTLSVDKLVSLLWGDDATRGATITLRTYVGKVRRVLEATGHPATLTGVAGSGYRFDTSPHVIDAECFERLLHEGRDLHRLGMPEKSGKKLEEALSLWRGDFLADLEGPGFATSTATRFEELRLVAWETWVDTQLEIGSSETVVPRLQSLVAAHPFRERLVAQLMLALYRAGRQADALAAAAATRHRLAEELGVDPSADVRELEGAILRQDPGLDIQAPQTRVPDLYRLQSGLLARTYAGRVIHPERNPEAPAVTEQRLHSTRTRDGVHVAYASVGHGPPLLFVGGWLSHLELSWALPAERQMLESLGEGRTLLRYDRPGCGLSDWASPVETSLESELDVIAAVLAAAGTERADVVASSLGVPLMIEWAARHPETVDRLALYGGWVRGADIGTPELQEHVIGLVAANWGLGADVLTDVFAPDASAGTRATLRTYQRQAASPQTASALLRLCYTIDVTRSLAHVKAPTLVVHRDQDRAAPVGQARLMASTIPDARLKELPGRSHLPYIGDAAPVVNSIRAHLGLPVKVSRKAPSLTTRQREVAALVAEGLTNREIGERLWIDERSAEGHLERIRLRLGLRSRAQIAAWWVATTSEELG